MRVLEHERVAVLPVRLRALRKQQHLAVRMLKWHQATQIEMEVLRKHFQTRQRQLSGRRSHVCHHRLRQLGHYERPRLQ
jgi:hypothetical protein